jgi:UDP-N-acetylmuramate dehydrogenase
LLEVSLRLVRRSPQIIAKNIHRFFKKKKETQDLSAKSAGCVFKNPAYHLTAAEMIESCGLKNRRWGQAKISEKHANYIINRNAAKARDVLNLMYLAQREVKEKFGVRLEPEIKIIGNDSKKRKNR